MKNRFAILAVVALSIATLSASASRADENDASAVRAASDNFYAALNTMFTGDVAPMVAVWSHADDVTYMGPGGGRSFGWDQVGPEWETQAAKKLGGVVKPEGLRMVVGNELAVVEVLEVGFNVNPEGAQEKVEIRATNTFRKENGHWKMIGHHTDLLPFIND